MNPEQLQALFNGVSLPGQSGFDSTMLLDQLTAGSASLSDFSTLEYRQQIIQSATDGLGQLLNAIPPEARNFSDPSGFVETYSFSTASINNDPDFFFSEERQENGLRLGNDTPLETNVVYVSESSSFPQTFIIEEDMAYLAQTEKDVNTFTVDNELLNVKLENNKSVSTAETFGGALEFVTDITTLNLGLADMPVLGLSLKNNEINGEGTESLTLSYLNGQGGLDSIDLLSPADLLAPLTLGAAEGFANNPDPTALLDTLTGLAELPEPIAALAGGDNPLASLGLPALPA